MIKSSGLKKISTAVFISGTGSNLRSLIKFSKKKGSKFTIELIISNNSKAKGLNYAQKFKIKKKIIDYSRKQNIDNKILKNLKKYNIKLICLAGFMKILSQNFIKKFNGKIINIHPSLLPKFKGLNTFQRILNKKEIKTGCTVHFVNEKLDSGKVIVQKSFYINKDDNLKTLKRKTQILEYKAYSEALIKVFRYN